MVFDSGEPSGSTSTSSNSNSSRSRTLRSGNTCQGTSFPTREVLPQFPCLFPGCDRSFGTAIGRGVHARRAHPDWTDEQAKIENKKEPWTREEMNMMARKEAQLMTMGVRFMNQELGKIFTNRTLESIKGKRRDPVYKERVQTYLRDVPNPADEADNEDDDDEVMIQHDIVAGGDGIGPVDLENEICNYIRNLPRLPEGNLMEHELWRICRSVQPGSKNGVFNDVSLYIKQIFKPSTMSRKTRIGAFSPQLSKRKTRRHEYAKIQEFWKKSPNKCLSYILKEIRVDELPPSHIATPFWERIMTNKPEEHPVINEYEDVMVQLWAPINESEIKSALPKRNTAPGPDGILATALREVSPGVLLRIFNIFLWCGRIPGFLLESKTTLIPKKYELQSPGDLRPITVSSVITRTFHKILANRMSKHVQLDERQKAFRNIDGCADNILTLDLLLRLHHGKHKPLFMVSLDVAKAYDSVGHAAIFEILKSKGLPPPMVDYIKYVYANSSTKLTCKDWTSHLIKPSCGVKQGDPLSPMIFNCVIDLLLKRLPDDIGASFGSTVMNSIAFADDIILFASTPRGLQHLLDSTVEYLQSCGMNVNPDKCLSVSIRNVPHVKKTIVDVQKKFRINGQEIKSLKRTDAWTYLGVSFTADGRTKVGTLNKLQDALNKVTSAPLKPQQRLYGLRTAILPSIYHQLVLGNIKISMFNKIDCTVRKYVRKWLSLPHDVPKAYIHADTKEGGLGVTAVRWHVPLLRMNRLKQFSRRLGNDGDDPDRFLSTEVSQLQKRLYKDGVVMDTLTKIKRMWANRLHNSVDGKALKDSRKVPNQHRWIMEPTKLLSGRDFVNLNKVRINALPVRSRTSRGRRRDRICRAGCYNIETLNHILQNCHRTHDVRIRRHNAIISFLDKKMTSQEFHVELEPHFKSEAGLRKPDLVAYRGATAFVIDAQVVSEQTDLNRAHKNKCEYYKELTTLIKDRYMVQNVILTSATLSCRGVWSPNSADHLKQLGFINANDIKILSTRVLIGGIIAFNMFNKRTTWKRMGIG